MTPIRKIPHWHMRAAEECCRCGAPVDQQVFRKIEDPLWWRLKDHREQTPPGCRSERVEIRCGFCVPCSKREDRFVGVDVQFSVIEGKRHYPKLGDMHQGKETAIGKRAKEEDEP